MDDFLTKPISPKEISAALDRWLGGKMETTSTPANLEPQASGIFDKAGFLRRLMDDDDLAKQIATAFVKEMPEHLTALETAIQSEDFGEASQVAHKLKGSAANLGAIALSQAASTAEQAAKNKDLVELKATLTSLHTLWAKTKQDITLWIENA